MTRPPGVGYHDNVMAHLEIFAALIAFLVLFVAWFAVPSSAPARETRQPGNEPAAEGFPSAA
jgi:hypothetical protein